MCYNHFFNLIHLILIIFFSEDFFFLWNFFSPQFHKRKIILLIKKLRKKCSTKMLFYTWKESSEGKNVYWKICFSLSFMRESFASSSRKKKNPWKDYLDKIPKILPVLRSWTQERNKQNEYKKNKWALKKNCFCSPIFFFIWLHTWKKTFPQKHFFFHAKKFVVKSFFLYFSHFFHKWTKKIFHSFSQMEKKSWEKEIYFVSHKLSWHFRFLFSFCFSFMWNFSFFLWKKIYFHTFTDKKKIRD